jgi:hypothetical protein
VKGHNISHYEEGMRTSITVPGDDQSATR